MYKRESERDGRVGWREGGSVGRAREIEREREIEGESVVNQSTSQGGREGKL